MAVAKPAPPGTGGGLGRRFLNPRRGGVAAVPVLALTAGSCDPVINVYGSFFPAWIVCLMFGVLLTVVARTLLAITGLERHMSPLLLVYPSLTVLFTCLTWLVFFRT